MKVANQLYPTFEQIAPLSRHDSKEPIAMVNLLKFREKAVYSDGRETSLSGRQAYMLYAREMKLIVERGGGRMIFSGDAQALVVGEVEKLWDAIAIVEYPSRAAFHQIATSSEVQAIGHHREAGLEGQLLILSGARDLL